MSEHKRKLTKIDLERMNLPEEYWLAKVDHVDLSVRDVVARYLRNVTRARARGIGLLVTGGKGVGKTAIAALVAKEARACGCTVLFSKVWSLREMLRARIWYDADMTMMERARAVDVLVLDDLREEDASERFLPLSELIELIKYRGARHRVTIVTVSSLVDLSRAPMDRLVAESTGMLVDLKVEGPNLYEQKHEELTKAVYGSR